MIKCKPQHLEARAAQRGYMMSEVSPCIVTRHSNGELTVDETHPAYPHFKKGLGDHVADGLAAVGITKERVARLAGKKDCGCKKRQKWLNQVGAKYLGIGHTPSPPTGD